MEKKIILVGGGGHALSLLEALPRAENVAGYLSLAPSQSMTVEWLGTDSDAPSFKNDHLSYCFCICRSASYEETSPADR